MSDTIWIVRNPSGKVIGASVLASRAVSDVISHCGATTKAAMIEIGNAVWDNKHGERYERDGYTLTREPLTPAPRVVVLDEWRVVDKRGYHATYHPFALRTPVDHAIAGDWCDQKAPQDAPHRVVRVALVEDATTEAPADGA